MQSRDMRIKAALYSTFILIGLVGILTEPALAQQSTTGPTPPPGIIRNYRAPSAAQVVIPGVPAYLWRHGCGPTALGMVIGYWDGHGYPNLVPGDASTQTSQVNAMIADDHGSAVCNSDYGDHYRDYSCPIDYSPNPIQPDKSSLGGAHSGNCVADFMKTSWSAMSNYYGWSWFDDVEPAFIDYVGYINPAYVPASTSYFFSQFTWSDYKREIDAGRPVVLLVDTDGNGGTDHFVTGIGYDDATMQYGIYDTWDRNIHWFQWRQLGTGAWSIYGLTLFDFSGGVMNVPVPSLSPGGLIILILLILAGSSWIYSRRKLAW
jgi:Peptidase_C39 like family